MLVALLAAAAALAPAYGGRTDEGRRIVLTTSHRSVVRVDAAVERYECEQFGDIGPLRIHARVQARIDGRGRFALTSGSRAERVSVTGTVTSRGATGTLRVRGTIATGQRCASPALRFSARPR